MQLRSFLYGLLLLTTIASLLLPIPAVRAGMQFQNPEAQALLATMTPEERVGQLFLVTFQGIDVHDQTQIYDLIANQHVGGVVLLAANDNFLPEPDTIPSVYQLISDLQKIEANTTTSSSPETSAQTGEKTYVPLFIGISQEGDGGPYDQILRGLTPLPNLMAIGATWNTDLARQVGAVAGSELSALGFNLFFGPSLDVVEEPNPSARIDLGPRVFGGDPFWVGEMGRAYITGLHTGSSSRMMVVAKHFPGRGASDRAPEEEPATVRKLLEQLKQVDLKPFFAVTNSPQLTSLTDGLLVSHIRYQGFQGNIRATTRPVSLDEPALSTIIQLPEFETWRGNGGLIVSDALGSQAVRDFYAQSGEAFAPRLVARDGFLAGNDLLYLGNITSEDAEDDTYTATLRILEFFAQEYRADRAFAERVDAAVLRILAQKLRMYGELSLSNVLAPENELAKIGTSEDIVFDVARSAATLINPSLEELNTLLPQPPNQNDRITFLTDTPMYKQCVTCLWQESLANDALQREVLRLYGPEGSGQVFTSRLNSFPFDELELMLNDETETDIEGVLDRTNWLVISLADVSDEQISLLRRFFAERPNLIRNKNVILFSFTAPYYLDPTDISKFQAYYALYSKQPAFVEMAARLLFQPQVTLEGHSPVSIPSVGYDLRTVTSPDPTQIIPLALDEAVQTTPTPTNQVLTPETPMGETETPTAVVVPTQTEIPLYRIGDTIAVRAGPIVDHNQNIVPDETPVRFIMSTRDEGGPILQQVDAFTVDGMARAEFAIDRPGKVEIRVVSEPAVISGAIQFDASNVGAAVTVVVPSVTATLVTVTPTLTPVVVENDLVTPEGNPRLGIWMVVMLAVLGGAVLIFWAVSRIVSPRWGLRWALCVFLGGMAAYNYLALDFPGATAWVISSGGAYGVLVLTFLGQVIGSLGAWIWMQVASGSRSPTD
ncbi:MAG TPA: glycoside hydrolase family 3 N-terminal domain-containing protein [Anaerolineales bacterium]|nr:glycoside hydrolase family 3 N-terminal domain-containing protein [Anaerolineales bacterium]